MIYEKGRLSQLWQRLKVGGPRFINIHGENWHKQTKLRFGAPDMSGAFYTAAAAGLAAALTTTLGNAGIISLAIALGGVFGNTLSHGVFRKQLLGAFSLTEKFAIDTKGSAIEPPNREALLMQVNILHTAARNNIAMIALVSLSAAVLINIAESGSETKFASSATDIMIGKTQEPYSQFALLFGLSAIKGMSMHMLQMYKISKRLLKGNYVFCATPPPQKQAAEQKLPMAAQRQAPRLAVRIS